MSLGMPHRGRIATTLDTIYPGVQWKQSLDQWFLKDHESVLWIAPRFLLTKMSNRPKKSVENDLNHILSDLINQATHLYPIAYSHTDMPSLLSFVYMFQESYSRATIYCVSQFCLFFTSCVC